MKPLKKNIIAIIKFMFEYNLFKKKQYKIRTYIFQNASFGALLGPRPATLVNNYNFQEESVRGFLDDLTDEFWIKPIDYGIDLLHIDDESMPRDVDLTKFTFSHLVSIYLALAPDKLGELWEWETIKRWTPIVSSAILATMHEYIINCTNITKKEVLEVLSDPLFGELNMNNMVYEATLMKNKVDSAINRPRPPPMPKPRPRHQPQTPSSTASISNVPAATPSIAVSNPTPKSP